MKKVWTWWWAWLLLAGMGVVSAFLPTKLNFSDPALEPFFCPKELSGKTWDHKAITREALRREVRRFFLESPPPASNGTFSIPEDATLTQIFRLYYGPTASPTRFIKAVNSIAWSNAMAEAGGQVRFDAKHHMDGERVVEGHVLLQGRYQQLVSTITVDEAYPFARELLGTSLNSIQDFYSQTTWLELGHTEVLQELGLPGMGIGEVAEGGEATCTNCVGSEGECFDNVILGGKLSSGYYEYDVIGGSAFVVPKPEGEGKCSHGGSMDTSSTTNARGGVNKETASPCFSPHHYLHQQAVDLAIEASTHYLSTLRTATSDDHFRHLLDLYPGSALSIIIDTTGSMTFEIQAVKEEAKMIVEKLKPELMILVPYGDPDWGPVTQTSDPNEFLEKLDSLEAYGGCCCLEEKFWHGLELALTHTPDYSNIFCFTDAGGNDAELMESVMALARNKRCEVNVVFSYNDNTALSQDTRQGGEGPGEEPKERPGEGPREKPGEKPGKEPGEGPEEGLVEEPKEKAEEEPEEKPGEEPKEKAEEEPGKESGKEPGEKAEEKPGEEPKEKPGEEPGEEPGEGPGEEPGEEPKEKPGEEPGEGPGEEPKEKPGEEAAARYCSPTYVLSGIEDYQRLAAETGGQFIEIDKFNVDEVVGILEDGVKESQVSIRMREEVTGVQDLLFPVDESVSQFSILISGNVNKATLSHWSAHYNLMDEVSLQGAEGVDIVSHTDGLKSIRFSNHSVGEWNIKVEGSSDKYSLAVSATSTLGFLAEFCELVLEPPRPSYRVIVGRPLVETEYYVEITLVGYLESQVENVTAMVLVDERGTILSQVDYRDEVDDHFYIYSEVLPNDPFYVQIDGFIKSGQTFSRVFPTMSMPAQCSLELLVQNSTMAAQAGQAATALYRLHNYGPDASFSVFATDEQKFVASWAPETSFVASLGSIYITVAFTVPNDAVHGTVSTVAVTAKSLLHGNNMNTAIDYFIVLPEEQDSEAPFCSSADAPDCSGHDADDTCDTKTWLVNAVLHDTASGLYSVSSQPRDNLTVDAFPLGTTSPVSASLSASCCVREFSIIGVDQRGNIGRCSWDLGRLKGSIIEFEVEAVGETWTYLRWNVSELRDDLLKYSVLTDEDFSQDSRCAELTCHMNVTYLASCSMHTFWLTPHYNTASGIVTEGSRWYQAATTLEIAPDAPSSPSTNYTSDTSATISWSPPSDLSCLRQYEVCYTRINSISEQCFLVENATHTAEGLESCTVYHVTVTSLSPAGLRGGHVTFDTNTDDAAPGSPEHLTVANQTSTAVTLSWDDPLDRASCIDRWMVSYKEITDHKAHDTRRTTLGDQLRGDQLGGDQLRGEADHYATIYDLRPCTNYTYYVSAVSRYGLQGGTRSARGRTGETEPSPVESVSATANGTVSIWASWSAAQVEECVDHYYTCIRDADTLTSDCYHTDDLQTVFTGLSPCVDYEVEVRSVSPSGQLGSAVFDPATTKDVPTGAPQDLEVVAVTSHSATITFAAPATFPQCVHEYDTRIINLSDANKRQKSLRQPGSLRTQEVFEGLTACTDYDIGLSAVTVSGFKSPEVGCNFTTAEATPSAPRGLNHTDVGAESVSLRWFAPETNTLCAVTYSVTWTSDLDSASEDFTFVDRPFEVKVTITGLAAATAYTFSVAAKTASGDGGPASDPCSVATRP